MVNSYFKVANDNNQIYFFDSFLKSSVETAWNKAYDAAQLYITKIRNEQLPRSYISVWKKPQESGAWDGTVLIGAGHSTVYQ